MSVLATGASVFGNPAQARNNPVAASPAVHQTVGQAPSSVTLAMKEPVKGPAVIKVTGPDGKVVSEPATTILATNIAVDLSVGLTRGTYTVKYRIEGPKGPEGGTYQFAYGSGTFSVKGIETWDGYKEIPKALRLKDDAEREKAAEETPATESPATSEPTDAVTPSDEDTKNASDEGAITGRWIWFATAAAVGLLAVGSAIFARRRSQAGDDEAESP